ncbi:rhamnopyranosyl-N-acetylglucosaminyl-diphospho-decaprenol beta-1,3/1,4-galactofuranosyltransferase [Arthrobacter ginsengisoli]|uniref:Rhamnopyranosyl-N-acetylglucosaminyl-diphospho-decaprenol beta-1,3/1,4-galactofuranosyltransferase n=1 Tax=Arthrobacter ginsengisoli TaxID=1356565 RepID=A0ABU1UCR7_9MICC|nr:glycosyltransferase [Arthrobacter ginsengisoli]MDR7082977.1 rhamnopyranosyl-N-acetylglucosaminyl-diphospho-decaprenol beta-1,3/1,4-galactofuranosyltransferase [Arthrobacter ginsengisoli]
MTLSVAVAAVTFDRPRELAVLLDAINNQTASVRSICLVDSGTVPAQDVARAHENVDYVRSEANLGGAGGFSLAILKAVATGADWIWMMDDDAEPADPDCLATLVREAEARSLEAVVPLVVAPGQPDRLSFFFRLDGKVTHDRAEVEKIGFLPDDGHFFNGALIRSDVFFKVGLPDMRLFIRGDEVDFTIRLRKAGIKFGTVTTTAITHPHAFAETKHVYGARWHVIVPESAFKRYFYYRNRGYLIRRHFRIKSLVADVGGYLGYFLRRGDLRGLADWFGAFSAGLRGKGFGPLEDQKF